MAAVAKASSGITPLMLKRNVRFVGIGNGFYPTASLAKQSGLSEAELAKIFWDGVNVDYPKMQAVGEELKKFLSGAKDVHITNGNGTDWFARRRNLRSSLTDRGSMPLDGSAFIGAKRPTSRAGRTRSRMR